MCHPSPSIHQHPPYQRTVVAVLRALTGLRRAGLPDCCMFCMDLSVVDSGVYLSFWSATALKELTAIAPAALVRDELKRWIGRPVLLLGDDPVRVDARGVGVRGQGGLVVRSVADRGRHAVDGLHLEADGCLTGAVPGVVDSLRG